ncbi:myoD family inhibitor domain-containing protein 2 [Pseudonaja textilis]|uniref:myoD family inhibitor domain-containing protein 2 n=1 Tax=Pseudonaja textilis TaxID=8673 RepID=UPI000EA85C15|nr:myoD family inhibitor domain-containing protein 2 [Pseudonaja textilis]
MSETETDIGKVRTQSFENDQRTTSVLLKEEHQLASKDDKSMKSIVLSSVSEFSITDVPSIDTRSDRKLSDSTTSSLSSLQKCETQFSYLEDAASSHERDNNDECATLILACLFCQFWEFLFMLPDVCENWLIDTCCPSYRYHQTSSDTSNNGDCSCSCDIDCSILESCQESGECLELALEVSQVCFH